MRESTVHAGGPRPARTRKTTYGATKVIRARASARALGRRPGDRTHRSSQRAGPQSGGVSAGSASAGRGRTLSVHVGTRKMVNYAWPG